MSKNKLTKFFAIPIIGFMILLIIVYFLQLSMTVSNQQDNSKAKLQLAENRIADYVNEEKKDWESYDSFIQSKSDMVALMLETLGSSAKTTTTLNEFKQKWGLEGVHIINGDSVISSSGDTVPKQAIIRLLSGERFYTEAGTGITYFLSKLSSGERLIVAQNSKTMRENEDNLISIEHALSNIKVGKNGFVVYYNYDKDAKKLSLEYAPKNSAFADKSSEQAVLTLTDGYNGWLELNGNEFYVTVKDLDNTRLVAVATQSDIMQTVFRSLIIAAIIFGCALILLSLYAMFLSRDIKNKRVRKSDVKGKLRVVSGVSLLVVFVLSFYTCLLTSISERQTRHIDKLDSVEQIIEQNTERIKQIKTTYEKEYLDRANRIAYLLQRCPQLINNDSLVELAKRAQLSSIYVFDGNGKTVATNTVFTDFVLSTDESAQSYEFWNVIKGYDDYIVQEMQKDDTVKHNLVQYIGVKRLDSKGMIEIGVSPERLQNRLFNDSLSDVLENIVVEDNGTITSTAVDKNTPKSHIGFTDNNGTNLTASRIIDNNNILVSVPITNMLYQSFFIALIITLVCAIIMVVFTLVISVGKGNTAYEYEEKEIADSDTASNRLHNINTPWRDLSAESKLGRLVFAIIVLVALALIVFVRIFNAGENNIIGFIMSMKWDLGINIYSISYVTFIALEIIFFSTLLRKIILSITKRNSERAETFGRLFNSLIKYIAFVGTIFYCLHFIGVDTTTLLASAGILTLGISLGAQSLVSDILAGLFIVFEGDFRVGDIVTIGDFRGTVREIGIRTTKIESPGRDVKIYKNSAISGVVNMTKRHSFAAVDCGIEYGESIERVEAILQTELPKIKEKLPKIVEGPFYKGISELGDSSVVIKVVAKCHESDRIQLTRDLNREIKLIFDNNNVGIPFPQIVVNKPEKKVKATQTQRLNAENFVEQQRELSENIVEDNN